MCFFQIKVDENGKIIDAKFKTFGCGSAIASSSLATEWVKGKFVSVALFCVFVHVLKVTCIVKHCVLQNFPLLTFSFRETLTVSLFFFIISSEIIILKAHVLVLYNVMSQF